MEDVILGEDGPERSRVIFYIHQFKNHNLFGIRKHFFSKKTGEFTPTKQGINLNRGSYQELRRIINENDETIMNWLGIGYVPEHVLRYQEAMEEARLKNAHLTGNVNAGFSSQPRMERFFEVEHKGNTDNVIFNSEHPAGNLLQDDFVEQMSSRDLRALITRILASYARAKVHLADQPVSSPSILFDQLEYDWSEFLRDFVED